MYASAIGQTIEFRCAVCEGAVELDDGAKSLTCTQCRGFFSFRECEHCASVEQVGPNAARAGRWRCRFCLGVSTVGRKTPALTADQRFSELEARELTTPDDIRLLGGFTHVGGTGFDITPGSVCSVTAKLPSVLVRIEIGPAKGEEFEIPYDELTHLGLTGGARTSGGGYFGGGFGAGALEGIAVASVLNALTTKTKISTGLHIGSTRGEMLFHHGEHLPTEIRNKLSPMFARHDAARHPSRQEPPKGSEDPLSQLERLVSLRDAGVLSSSEYQAARAKYVAQLTQDA